MCVFMVSGFSPTRDKTLFTLSPGAHNQHNLSSYSLLSHHAFQQQYQLSGIPEGHPLKSDSGLMTGGTLWDMDNMGHPVGSYPGASGHQPGSSHAGGDTLCLWSHPRPIIYEDN